MKIKDNLKIQGFFKTVHTLVLSRRSGGNIEIYRKGEQKSLNKLQAFDRGTVCIHKVITPQGGPLQIHNTNISPSN